MTDAQTGEPISGAGVVTVIEGSGIFVASTQTDQNGNNDSIAFSTGIQLELPSSDVGFNCRPR